MRDRKWFCASQALRVLLRSGAALRAPARLAGQDLAENFRLGQAPRGKGWAAAMVERVLWGTLPLAILELRKGKRRILSEAVLRKVLGPLGLACEVVKNHRGVHEALVFQRGATLGDFYDADHAVALYTGAGAALTPEAFRSQLDVLALRLTSEDFGRDLQHPMLGLLLGYPLREAVAMLDPRLRCARPPGVRPARPARPVCWADRAGVSAGRPARPASTC